MRVWLAALLLLTGGVLVAVACIAAWRPFGGRSGTGPHFLRLEGIVHADRDGTVHWRPIIEPQSDEAVVGRCSIVLPPATHFGGVLTWASVYGGYVDAEETDPAFRVAAAEAAIAWLRADGAQTPLLAFGLKALESRRGYYFVRHSGNIAIELSCWGALVLVVGLACGRVRIARRCRVGGRGG